MKLHNHCNWQTIQLGVLALQGGFQEHQKMLRRLVAEMEGALDLRLREVRLPEELIGLHGLIIPGGESTTFAKLAQEFSLLEPLRNFAAQTPTWGTCAGMIFLAKQLKNAAELGATPQSVLGLMDLTVKRNAFGRQVDSFVTDLTIRGLRGGKFRAVFIRAPIVSELGPAVQVLARLADGRIVAARQGHLLATSFHPELGNDLRLHRLFLNMVAERLPRR